MPWPQPAAVEARHGDAGPAPPRRNGRIDHSSDFYDRSVGDLRPEVRRFIETELITERGFRKQCDVDDAQVHYGLSEEELTSLVDRRLLRIEPERGSDRVELTHDLLTGVVRAGRERARERERAAVRARQWGRRAIAAGAAVVAALVFFVIREQRNHDRLLLEENRLLAQVNAQNAHSSSSIRFLLRRRKRASQR